MAGATADPAAAERMELAAAAHLRLAAGLVRRLGADALGVQGLLRRSDGLPVAQATHRLQRLVIDEVPDEVPPGPPAFLGALLAAALYGPAEQLQLPWCRPPASCAATELLCVLRDQCAPCCLEGASSSPHAAGPTGPVAAGEAGSSSGGGAACMPQAAGVQELLAAALPAAVGALRPTFAAYQDHHSAPSTRMEPYVGEAGGAAQPRTGRRAVVALPRGTGGAAGGASPLAPCRRAGFAPRRSQPRGRRPTFDACTAGPEAFERYVAGSQLVWLVLQLRGRALGAAVASALPCLLTLVDDPSPPVQSLGLWALQHLVDEGPAADIR